MDKPHRKLEVWQKGVNFATEIYQVTNEFPSNEQYGLISQMRRAAVSIPSNLAEGATRETAEFIQFARIAIGSVSELDTHLEIAHRLGYLPDNTYYHLDQELTQIDRMLIGLRKSLLKSKGERSEE